MAFAWLLREHLVAWAELAGFEVPALVRSLAQVPSVAQLEAASNAALCGCERAVEVVEATFTP